MLSQNTNILIRCLCSDSNIHHCSQIDWEGVVEASRAHLVAPLLYLRLKGKESIPGPIMKRLEALYHTNLGLNIRRLQDLGKYLKLLAEKNIPVIVLKGCHLSECVYGNMGARVFSDADIMVRPEDLDRAQRCLLDAGAFEPESPLLIDFHWYLEDSLNLDMTRIWSRMQPAVIGGSDAYGLSPEDLLIHICLHLGFHHSFEFFGLRTLCDIHEILQRYGETLDWTYITTTAFDANISRAVFLPLHLAKKLMSSPVPETVLTALSHEEDMTAPEQWALSQMFDTKGPESLPALSPHFWRLWTSGSSRGKALSLRKVVLPDRKYIAQKYPANHRSLKTYYYYLVRLKQNAGRYLSAFIRILLNDPSMSRLLDRERQKIHMREWLGERRELTEIGGLRAEVGTAEETKRGRAEGEGTRGG